MYSQKDETVVQKPNFYIPIYTRPLYNHPFLVFGSLADNFFTILVPIGNNTGHLKIDTINNVAHYLTIVGKK